MGTPRSRSGLGLAIKPLNLPGMHLAFFTVYGHVKLMLVGGMNMTIGIPLTTRWILDNLSNPEVKIIDIRPIDAYNGWRFNGEARGGHIKNAKALPFKWTAYFDWLDIVKSKGISPTDTIVIYGYDNQEIEKAAGFFIRAGFEDVNVYNEFSSEWCADKDLPMSRLQRYSQLVPPGWVRSHMAVGDKRIQNNIVVCHAHYRNRSAYEEGHIPGAVDLDTNSLESPGDWNCRSPSELKDALEETGITSDTTVILYGRNSVPSEDDPFPGSSAGQLGAMRCAFILLYAGVKDVRVLNGGLQAWLDEGYEITTENTPKKPVLEFGASIPGSPQLLVDLTGAKEILRSADKNLVCVRSFREYTGEVSGYNYIHKKGRIPGAVFADCGSDAYHMENYRNVDHTMREYHEIENLWSASSITSDRHNSFYCGTGWRASEAFFNAWLMGWNNISVFDGGWLEWSNDENNPCETGTPHGSH